MSLNIAEVATALVEHDLALPFTVFLDFIPDADNDGACLRHDPSPAAERRFLDGSRLVTWNLTFYVRCKKSQEARAYALAITDKLDGTEIEVEGVSVDIETATLPQYIETDNKGFTLYSASIKCTYCKEAE